MKKRLYRLSLYIRGWMGYYALSKYYTPLPGLDNWIRRRVRMCYLKQWPMTRTRVQNLIKLGAPRLQAIGVGLSCKGPWRLAKTYGSQCGLTNAYLAAQGLVSVLDLWVAFQLSEVSCVEPPDADPACPVVWWRARENLALTRLGHPICTQKN